VEYKSKLTKSYLAGYFDGDGTVFITTNHGYKVLLSAFISTDLVILKEIQKLYGGYFRIRKAIGHQKAVYNLVIERKKAVPFLKDIYPYAIIKKPRIEAAIKWQTTKNLKLKNKLFRFIKKQNQRAVNPNKLK
jgi:hypothetical protein